MPFFSKLASASRLSVASTLRPDNDGGAGASNEKGGDQDELYSSMWADDDDSKSLADDNASIFSFTPTLVDRRTGVLAYSSDVIASAPDPLPGADLYASFVANYELWTPKASMFIRHGLPARVKRGQNKAILTKLIKSIIVQFPLRTLDEVGYHPHPQTLADIAARRAAHQRTRNTHGMGTVWTFEAIDLTGIREKTLMGLVLEVLLKADDDVHNAHLIYPPENVRSAPKGLANKDGNVVVDVKWATLRILTPESPSLTAGKGKETAKANDGLTKEKDEELLARLFEPSAEANQILDRVLEHLERRGGVWTHAGHFTGHSFKNTDPKARPEFTVHGVFPTSLLNRFKKYRVKNRTPMPSDLQEKVQPLVLYTIGERLRGDGDATSSATEDVLEGFSVAVTEEPYRTGRGVWANPAVAMAVSGGFA